VSEIHMGQLLERVVRKKELNITELAKAIGVQRRTLYNWFSSRVLSPEILHRISKVIVYDFEQPEQLPTIIAPSIVDLATDLVTVKNEEYWKDRYIDLLERYSEILNSNLSERFLEPVLT
jgi:transcriptional regulator with XRE-family HTH domain